jgi:hypothetical protein
VLNNFHWHGMHLHQHWRRRWGRRWRRKKVNQDGIKATSSIKYNQMFFPF